MLGAAAGLEVPFRTLPAWAARGAGVAIGGAYRLVRRQAPVCREMIETMLHGHALDGSRAERELGVAYTPLERTFERAVEWYQRNGHL